MPEQPVTQMTADEFREELRKRGFKRRRKLSLDLWRRESTGLTVRKADFSPFWTLQHGLFHTNRDEFYRTNPADLLPLIDGYTNEKGDAR